MRHQTLSFISIFILLFSITACDSYQKLLKSSDFELKYKKVKEFYNAGEYFKSIPLFEELMTVYKGTKDIEKLYYFYAYAHYGQTDYMLASHYFKQFVSYYPNSVYAEDAYYMHAYSQYKMSPPISLEQTSSEKAIEAFQLFINTYPDSDKVAKCNELMDEMRFKLEEKAFQSAELYYKISSYKAAVTSFNQLLVDFSDTRRKPQILFLILKSHYLLAENSVPSKRQERYTEAVNAYYSLIDKYPKNEYTKEAEKIFTSCQENLTKITKQKETDEQQKKKI